MKFSKLLIENKIKLGIAILFGLWGIQRTRVHLQERKMDKISRLKKESCYKQIRDYIAIHQPCTLPQEIQTYILNSNISQIHQLLYEKKSSVQQLLLFFIERVLKLACWDNLNLITEINFIAALEEAKQQDLWIQEDPEIINKFPLFGIPISVKDTLIMKGFDSTLGIGANCFKPSDEDGPQIAQIRLAKGIIFVRTNIPQLALTFEAVNPIFGRSLNPWNRNRTTGGSSGGEGGLTASRCNVIGLGTDLGGSIRIPSAFCGVYGLKPNTKRIPDQGEVSISQAFSGIMQLKPSIGPIARCVDDLIVVTKVLFDKQIYSQIPYQIKDPYFEPLELGEFPKKQQLRIGYFYIFDDLQTPNCMKRAVREACQALQSKGHDIIEFKTNEYLDHFIAKSFLKIMNADGMKFILPLLNGQKHIKELDPLVQSTIIPQFIKKYILGTLFNLLGQNTLSKYNDTHTNDVYQYLVDTGNRKQSKVTFLQYMKQKRLDVIICPGFALPAIKHGQSSQLGIASIYTWIWNTLDLPVGSLPITVVQNEQDQYIKGQDTNDIIYKIMKENMIDSDGLPVNVQVVSYPNQEEMVLRVMKEIEEVIQFNKKHPYPY